MKIGVINNLYKPYKRGGAESVAEKIVAEAAALGHEVFIISSAPDKSYVMNNTYYLKSAYYNLGQKSAAFKAFWHLANTFNIHKYYQVRSILKKTKPDIVICNNLMGLGFFLPNLLLKLKIKNIQILHDIQLLHPSGLMYFGHEEIINSLFAKIYQNFTRDLFGTPDLVVSPSQWLMNLYTEKNFFNGAKRIVLENPNQFATIAASKNLSGEKNITKFIYVGLIEEHKGIIFLAKAFKEISDPFIELTIIGDGAQSNDLRQIISLDKRFKWLGRRDKDEVQSAMAESDAVIVPSLCYENSPTVIYEAHNVGKTFIGSDLGGIPELAQKYGGLLFQAGNGVDLKEKIRYFIKNKASISTKQDLGNLKPYLNSLLENL